ncbi:uncharacterized protein K444DRAFT_633188 [Hyaloscypha bicolor E]|uniref:Uncharacterized protein n=1 Tax=Hyaloscypha bicolor E TaxID=1095630 RepID=A0A2J6SXY1_9HELO|nr:uncharacterized protein K444DRAFT_633188 [Hyaloscypha bicolor E]PMD55636.1 hypothetical protein K444DRAFT_633188 [Hyaloscypha bicolor E]
MVIDLIPPWETFFTPGQHTEMSMVFSIERVGPEVFTTYCPKCGDANLVNAVTNQDIECQKYNMVYKRTLSVIMNPQAPPMFITPSPITRNLAGTTGFLAADARSPKPPKRRQPQDEESEMALFRRVRIKTEFNLPAPMKKCSWDPRQDRTWMEARARRLNWDQIQQAHFPSKSPMIVGDGTNP